MERRATLYGADALGSPLYEASGFVAAEEVEDATSGVAVPLTKMRKPIGCPTAGHGITSHAPLFRTLPLHFESNICTIRA